MSTDYTYQLQRKLAADVDNASSPDQYRFFLEFNSGLLAIKDSSGNVTIIGGNQSVSFIHNPVIDSTDSPYSAAIRETVKADPSSGAVTVRLPTAVLNAGKQVQVVSMSPLPGPPPNNITVEGILGQTINGLPTFDLTTPQESLLVESDGANWIIL